MTHQVILSLASNQHQQQNLSKARRRLEEILSNVRFTTECWTAPLGHHPSPDDYLNQLAAAQTELDESTLTQRLKQTEQALGRTPEARNQGIVPIDLDILSFDGQRRHPADWQRPYVKQLVRELTEAPQSE